MRVRLRPRSDIKEIPLLLIGPKVSKASGMKVYESSSALYFIFLRSAAISAAAPAVAAVAGKYEAARVSITVASHIRLRPLLLLLLLLLCYNYCKALKSKSNHICANHVRLDNMVGYTSKKKKENMERLIHKIRHRGYMPMENEGATELARKAYENLFKVVCS